ncbi:MAG: hypothetical protein M5R36_06090 [Deltaproteobacteria bacterium]|nr:hypothetical protein [Deltaproteobacteria bacterium]
MLKSSSPFDPANEFFEDRRCFNWPPYKEDRLFVARIDRTDGTPLAALVSFPVHGVMIWSPYMTADVPGIVEWGLQRTFDRPVEAYFFLQGPAGDVNPHGSPLGHKGPQEMEWYARRITPVLRSFYDTLTPHANPALRMVSRRIAPTRDAIGYAPGEFGTVNPITGRFDEYTDGAFYCGSPDIWNGTSYFTDRGSIVDCDDPSTEMLDGYYGCVVPDFLIGPFWRDLFPVTEVADIVMDDCLLSLIPGELTGYLSQNLRTGLEDALGWPADKIATFGYSQGHQFYLLTEWDWKQGGYETSISIWGPKYGDWLVSQAVDLAAALQAPDDGDPPPRFPEPVGLPPGFCPTGFEPALNAGDIVEQPSNEYERFDTVRFSWLGGYSGADDFHVVFEAWDGDRFEPAGFPDGRILTDESFDTILSHEAQPDYSARRFPAARGEPLYDPMGASGRRRDRRLSDSG